VIHLPSTDPAFVAPDAIPWLLLQVVGIQGGPTGGTALTATTFLQRVNTYGGVAPSTGCGSPSDVGAKAFVPYEADYFFFRKDGGEQDQRAGAVPSPGAFRLPGRESRGPIQGRSAWLGLTETIVRYI
jgi:hypothetical protein